MLAILNATVVRKLRKQSDEVGIGSRNPTIETFRISAEFPDH